MTRSARLRRALLAALVRPGPGRLRDAAGADDRAPPAPGSVLRSLKLDSAAEDRVLALDPEHISGADVHDTLAAIPAPHVVLLHGGIYPVYLAMTSFAEFLIGMGYPEDRIRRQDGVLDSTYSYSPYQDSTQIAGMIAWYYEHDGVRPMMVGHSQGGVQAVKILYEFAGASGGEHRGVEPDHRPLGGPHDDRRSADRGDEHPSSGSWSRTRRPSGPGALRCCCRINGAWCIACGAIPDTVDDFTGFTISVDFVALSFPGSRGASEFHHNGTANVRNVILPSSYNHVVVPVTRELASSPAMRDWINTYVPDKPGQEASAAARPDRQRSLGGRRLVQHQEALVPRGAATRARQARPDCGA